MDSDTRRETVNALAARAKTERAVIPELWEMVDVLIKQVCWKYCGIEMQTWWYEYEDLCQNAYFHFLKAIEAYNPDRGAFSTVLTLYIRRACNQEVRRYRPEVNPINAAVSLDKPLDDTNEIALVDILPDAYALGFVDELSMHSVAQVILDEAERLPNPIQTRIIRECTYQGRTLESFGNEIGVTKQMVSSMQGDAIRRLRRRPVIRSIQKDFFKECEATARESAVDPYLVKGLTAFRSDFTSAIEEIVMKLVGETNQQPNQQST